MPNWLSNINHTMIERASQRPGSTNTTGQFGGQQIVDHRAQTAQDEADRERYADRYRQAYAEYRRAMGYDDDEEETKR